jgi:hypothetical protein
MNGSPTLSGRHPGWLPGSPFGLDDEAAYRSWRAQKLADYPCSAQALMVEIDDALALSPSEHAKLLARCHKANCALYVTQGSAASAKGMLKRLGEQLGLRRLDGNLCADEDAITSIRNVGHGRHRGYIPYSNRALNWHTDGYYNPPGRPVRSWALHCARNAAVGGESAILDCEIAYILLRDENPDFIAALMQPDAMTIPGNWEKGVELRSAQTGPVLWVDGETGTLQMRYTARKRNIRWKNDPRVHGATAFLEHLWREGSTFILRHRLEPGQGFISNNSLHSRTGFQDDPASGRARLLYRARYYDRIAGTDFRTVYAGQAGV